MHFTLKYQQFNLSLRYFIILLRDMYLLYMQDGLYIDLPLEVKRLDIIS